MFVAIYRSTGCYWQRNLSVSTRNWTKICYHNGSESSCCSIEPCLEWSQSQCRYWCMSFVLVFVVLISFEILLLLFFLLLFLVKVTISESDGVGWKWICWVSEIPRNSKFIFFKFTFQRRRTSNSYRFVFVCVHEKVWLPARHIVEDAIRQRFDIDQSGEIIVLSQFCPWKEHLVQLEKELKCEKSIKYVLFSEGSQWYKLSKTRETQLPDCFNWFFCLSGVET